jgi:LmbE family N-acetylglucosaminyl deacetylase
MSALVVISPHRDDAAFSLGLLLVTWAERGRPLQIINCFTISDYAPLRQGVGTAEVTRLRRNEDDAFAVRLGAHFRWHDLGLLDAPLRLGCSSDIVCELVPGDRDAADIDVLARALEAAMGQGVLLAPLAIGNHIDHAITLLACTRLSTRCPLAFYEDLPYAAELDLEDIQSPVGAVAAASGRTLEPVVVSHPDAECQKEQLIRLYESQLSEEERLLILSHTRGLGGERIWADRDGAEILRSLEKDR